MCCVLIDIKMSVLTVAKAFPFNDVLEGLEVDFGMVS